MLFLIIPIYNYFFSDIINLINFTSFIYNIIIFSFLVAPVAFVVGSFFPLSVMTLNKNEPELNIAWFYIMGVIGSILALSIGLALPILIGFTRSLQLISIIIFIQITLLYFLSKNITIS